MSERISGRWFRVACDFASNPKVFHAGPQGWFIFSYLLGRNEAKRYDGFIPFHAVSRPLLANLMRETDENVDAAFADCEAAKLIAIEADGIRLVGWNGEWKHTDTSTDRVRKHRETKRNVSAVSVKRVKRVREDKIREDKIREDLSIPSGIDRRPSANGQPAIAEVTEAFNRAFSRTLGASGFKKPVERLLRDGYSLDEVKAVVWWGATEWADDPDWRMKISPSTLFKLVSPQGHRTFPEYLALAAERWREKHGGECPPWEREASPTNGVSA